MGLFDKIFKRPARPDQTPQGFFKTFTAYTPLFTSWGGCIYESEMVRAAIHARATHISKLAMQVSGTAKPKLQTRLRAGPNEFQTWGQFNYRLSTILDVQNTAFIVPIFDELDQVSGIYPLLPSMCEVLQYGGEPWLRYTFSSGQKAAVELRCCGVLTKFQYQDDFFGSSNRALNPTMDLITLQNQAIGEAVKNSATFRFMAKVNNFAKNEDLAKERKRFNDTNLRGEGGLLLFPNTYDDVKQITAQPYTLDAGQMQQIKARVNDYFGVNDDILQNKAYGDAWSAFYEGAIEPYAIQLSDVLTKMLFTERERAAGAQIMATANRLQYMTNKEKLEVSSQMADRGIFNRDTIREIWNLPPLPDGQGQAYTIRGEYWLHHEDGTATRKGDDLTDGT